MKKLLMVLLLILFVGCENVEKNTDSYVMVNADQASSIMDEKSDFILIDVRTSDEFLSSHITNAINIPLGEIEEKIVSAVSDKNQIIIVYC